MCDTPTCNPRLGAQETGAFIARAFGKMSTGSPLCKTFVQINSALRSPRRRSTGMACNLRINFPNTGMGKTSALARYQSSRPVATPIITGSTKEQWLAAKIAAPDWGCDAALQRATGTRKRPRRRPATSNSDKMSFVSSPKIPPLRFVDEYPVPSIRLFVHFPRGQVPQFDPLVLQPTPPWCRYAPHLAQATRRVATGFVGRGHPACEYRPTTTQNQGDSPVFCKSLSRRRARSPGSAIRKNFQFCIWKNRRTRIAAL